eukprot:2227591-Rhodomonas_salina.1
MDCGSWAKDVVRIDGLWVAGARVSGGLGGHDRGGRPLRRPGPARPPSLPGCHAQVHSQRCALCPAPCTLDPR